MLKQDNNLTFDEQTHTYFLGEERIPSVSEIMKPMTQPTMDSVPPWRLEKARDRGTKVHQIISDYILFDIIEVEEDFQPYLNTFVSFLLDNDLHPVYSEFMLTNGEYAGTVDLVLKNDKNDLLLVDIKVTYAIPKSIGTQLGAYNNLLSYNGCEVSKSYCLHMKKDSYVFKEIEPDFDKWKELLDEHKNKKHKY